MKTISAFVMLIATAFFAGCAGMSHQVDTEAVHKIKTAALVAFAVDEPASVEIGFNLGSGKVEGAQGGSMIPQFDAHSDEIFRDLAKSFAEQMHWKMPEISFMLSSSGYRHAFDSTMKGFHNKLPPGAGTKRFLVKDVMDFDSGRILGPEGRDALIKALQVDALIVAQVNVSLHGTTVMGIGSRHPQSRLHFTVYTLGQSKPVWFEGGLEGEESKESVGKTGFIDEKALGRLALASAKTAFTKIGEAAH
jgi:hypothetical protein